jgi:topoisomerase IA-like protein
MPQDLTPRVIESRDDERWEQDTGKLRRYTIVRYRLGDFGPFTEEFDRDKFSESELRQRMAAKADTLRNYT